MTPKSGPAYMVLATSVARRYYLDGRSKVDIAEEFGLSRFKVARLLESARDRGLVHIEIRPAGIVDVDLSGRLQDAFGLSHAVVVDVPDDEPGHLCQQLGITTAELLTEIITSDDVLGLTWARSVGVMGRALTALPMVPVVQLTGALSLPDSEYGTIDLVRDVARVTSGPAYVFYAPFVVADAGAAQALRQQPEIARAFAQMPRVTRAVAALGVWAPGGSALYDAVGQPDQDALTALGVCAEVAGVFLTEAGDPLTTELNARLICIGADQMRAIPGLVVIAHGADKVGALRAALASGLVGAVVTHAALARAVLEVPARVPSRAAPSKHDSARSAP